jgi:DNA-binding protein H-NS
MKTNYTKLSENDLVGVIAKAEKELQARKQKKRKGVINEIKILAASIGSEVEITQGSGNKKSRLKGQKVPPKYQNPADPSQQWSGRGMKPKWLTEQLGKGAKIEQFKI